jgi:hypothetical protein
MPENNPRAYPTLFYNQTTGEAKRTRCRNDFKRLFAAKARNDQDNELREMFALKKYIKRRLDGCFS